MSRLASNQPHEELVPARVMRAVLTTALADAQLVDQAKKALMYGKDGSVIAAFREKVLLTREMVKDKGYPEADREDGMRRLHAALGMRSEADEILQQELSILCGGRPVTEAEQVDEIGDLGWYAQLYCNAIRYPVVEVLRKNVAKLIKRFNGLSFDAERAKNPDKAAEAAAQAGAA